MNDIKKFIRESLIKFNEKENRAVFYEMAMNLIKNNYEIEGFLLILSTWNFAFFRYGVKSFDRENFESKLQEAFSKLNSIDELKKERNFFNINFDTHGDSIIKAYEKLSNHEIIGHTGASKILHMKFPEAFVMWDDYITIRKPYKYYKNLKIIKTLKINEICNNANKKLKRFTKNKESYLDFLKCMQQLYINYLDDELLNENFLQGKTIPKIIDEINYVNFTLPIVRQIKEKETRNKY